MVRDNIHARGIFVLVHVPPDICVRVKVFESYYINPEVTDYYVCGFVALCLCVCALNTAKKVAYPVRAYGTV